ncbi:MAG: trypsin-like peptidase domain-containing protein [Clostridia bacterium]|nr:trypsin-like peptidase domain-containing protein [Clostridia bacterium]
MEPREDLVPEAENTLLTEHDENINESAVQNVTEEGALPEKSVADAPDWSFGRDPSVQTSRAGGAGRFFGVFSAVVALCMALLIALLFLGETGIRIYNVVTHDRTVFVKDEGAKEHGMLAPEEAADLIKKSTVTVTVRTKTGTGHGSGFVYSSNGYICTNHHVVEDAVSVQVILPDGQAIDATVVGTNAAADIAVLKINKTGLTPVKLGTSSAALVGESVVAVGTPATLDYAATATFGKISATGRVVSITDENGTVTKRMTVLQTDTSVNPGNSGGPLANMYGEVIGIVVMKVSYYGGSVFDGIGFALPIDGAKVIIDAIIKDGKFEGENPIATGRSLLGVTGRGLLGGYWYSSLTADEIKQSETEVEGYVYMPFDGVLVTIAESVNVKGKILAGDMVTKINGLNMYTIYDVINMVNRHGAGEVLTITVKRPVGGDYANCEELTFEITLLAEDLK